MGCNVLARMSDNIPVLPPAGMYRSALTFESFRTKERID
jgi:hypothetical protein